ncbi:hypothetical protein EV126DRAFT_410095 [Verticillium dahliae]|nr:hypothetical protein EV126DRAFT_410095 [Verticillium dahliae]
MSRTSTSPRLRLASSVICTCVTHGLDMGTNRIRSMMRTDSSATLGSPRCAIPTPLAGLGLSMPMTSSVNRPWVRLSGRRVRNNSTSR